MNQQLNFSKIYFIKDLPEPSSGQGISYDERYISPLDRNIRTAELTPNEGYIPTQKDKLYFYKDCQVPRHKVREWGKKNKISVTIKPENATATFYSDKTVRSLIGYEYFIKIETVQFITWVNHNYTASKANQITISSMMDFVRKLSSYSEKYIYLAWRCKTQKRWFSKYYYTHNRNQNPNYVPIEDLGYTTEDNYTDYLTISDYTSLQTILSDTNLYHQNDLLHYINEDAAIIDGDMYEQIKNMLASQDKSNHIMAIEILANANTNASLHYIMLLLKQFGETIYYTKNSKHVNFKSLLKYLGLEKSYRWISEDVIVDVMMDKDVFTRESLAQLAEKIKPVLAKNSDTKHFKLKTITVSDEIKNYFKQKEAQKENTNVELANIEDNGDNNSQE